MHDNNLSLNQLIDNEIIQNDGEIQKLMTKVNNQTPQSSQSPTRLSNAQYVPIDQHNGVVTTNSEQERKIITNYIKQNKPNE